MNQQPFSQDEKQDEFFVQDEQSAPKEGASDQVNIFSKNEEEVALLRAQMQFKTARLNLLIVAVFTVINIVAYFFSEFYMLFSANIPYLVTVLGDLIAVELEIPVLTYLSVAASVVLTVPYFLGYFLSQKHYGWIVACLVYFSLDTVAMLLFGFLTGGIGTALLDIVFHAWVIYELFKGIRVGKDLKEAKTNATTAEEESKE